MRSLSIFLFLATASGACSSGASVQASANRPEIGQRTGLIRGVVRNEDGWELSEIAVLAVSEIGGGSRTGYSDTRGIYAIHDLAPGTYTLRVRRGAALVLEQTVTVASGASRDVHLRLPTKYGDRPEQRSKPVVDRALIHSSASRAW